MKTIVLKFDGMQSWGVQSKLWLRGTLDFPTLSGATGILRGACGIYEENGDPLWDRFNKLDMVVMVEESGHKEYDFCTAGVDGIKTLNGVKVGTKIIHRYYLSDAIFYVALYGDDELIDIIESGLDAPKNGMYMGRRCFPVNMDFFVGVYKNKKPENILKSLSKKEKAMFVIESQDDDITSQIIMDRPLANKRFAARKIKKVWLKTGVKNAPDKS